MTPEHRPRPDGSLREDMRRGCMAVVLCVGTIVLATIIAASVTSMVFTVAFGESSGEQHAQILTWSGLLTFQVALVAILTAAISNFHSAPMSYILALHRPRAPTSEILSLFALIVVVVGAYTYLALSFFREDVLRDLAVFQELVRDMPIWLPIAGLVVGAPVSEELLFRGYLLGRLAETRLGFLRAAIVSTFLWTLLHIGYSTVGLFEVFLAGMLFSLALWRTSSLWVPIIFHAIYNACVLTVILTMPLSAS
ncbi:MAG: CPBP family intramembrane glutamic endopeptidase [Hyphomicrobiaceae bacterium]